MEIFQRTISLKARRRGFHLITDEVENAIPEIANMKVGMCQVFIQHTSASLTINENADPTVRVDFEMYFNRRLEKMIQTMNMIMRARMTCLPI